MKIDEFPVEPADIVGRVDWALLCLREAPSDCIVTGTVLAVRSIVGSFHHPHRQDAPGATVQALKDALREAVQRVEDESAPMDPGRVREGIGSAIRILSLFNLPNEARCTEAAFQHALDDIDHAILLTDELSAGLRRRSIAARAAAGFGSFRSATTPKTAGGMLH